MIFWFGNGPQIVPNQSPLSMLEIGVVSVLSDFGMLKLVSSFVHLCSNCLLICGCSKVIKMPSDVSRSFLCWRFRSRISKCSNIYSRNKLSVAYSECMRCFSKKVDWYVSQCFMWLCICDSDLVRCSKILVCNKRLVSPIYSSVQSHRNL